MRLRSARRGVSTAISAEHVRQHFRLPALRRDGGHRFDLWSISKDTSLLVYNAHFVNNMAPYYPFMAGTNKPYVDGKVLYVNVRFR